MEYEIVMGLEVHVELLTKTKIFCGCTTEFGGEPNSHTCPVCLGLPGSLPVLNKGVVDRAIRAGIALNCDIQTTNVFDRKNYFYPDLPKDYQISQLYHPICRNGYLEIQVSGEKKKISILEIHMEEDAGKLVHDASGTLIDYNRCGVPLIEIVSNPDFRSAEEVIQYLERLREMLVFLDVSDCKMQEGSMRADVNLSVRPMGTTEYGTRTEMKNINSFKSIQRAIAYESERQIALIQAGGTVRQQTRRWDDEMGETYAMRSKENAQDYRYFPDPDLLPINIKPEWIEETKNALPELPQSKRRRYIEEMGVEKDIAKILTSEKSLAMLFEATAKASGKPKEAANAITGDILGLLKETGMLAENLKIDPEKLAAVIKLVSEEKVNRNVGKDLISELFRNDIDPEKYVKEKGLLIIEDLELIGSTIKEILETNPQSVADYKAGKEKAFGFLVGQTMRQLKGKASPRSINGILKEKLDGVKFEPEEAEAAEKQIKAEKEAARKKRDEAAISDELSERPDAEQRAQQAPVLTAAQKALAKATEIKPGDTAEAEAKPFAFRENKYRTHTCADLTKADVGSSVRVAGWVATIRDHGGIIFIDLRDHYGVTQIVASEEQFAGIGKETVISVAGEVVERDSETVNTNIVTGMVEVKANAITVLGRSKTNLPFEIEASRETREDVRLAYRFLDLRNTKVHDNIVLRSKIINFMRRTMEEMGFLEIQTPILANSSPEGARDFLVPSRKHKGSFYALPQAPQQFKQMLMASGFDRYFQIAPCFRDEDARLDRSPGEFYQLDFEMAFATQEDVFVVAEKLLYDTFSQFSDLEISKPPFVRIPYAESMLKYGTDKPDLRNPLLISDLSEFFSKVDFKPFREKTVRGIRVPEAIKQSKSWFSSMEKFALGIGMKGLGYISVKEEMTYKGPIDKFLTDEQRVEIAEIAQLKSGDVLYFISDEKGAAEKFAGQIRTELGKRLELIDKTKFEFCYITDFPMFEINEETGQTDFTHNPFSMPQGEMEALENMDPLEICAYQYDIVCNGYELSSGAVRNHRPEIMVKAFEIAGYTEEDVKNKFKALYRAFKYGAPPHAGMAPGVDRIVMLLTGEENIREVITFPLNSNAQDLLFGSPGEVTEQQLREVHIKIR